MTGLAIDAATGNQDWTKKSWDLPPYKSDDFLALVLDLPAFRKLPVYKTAVRNGLIVDDEWNGELVDGKWRPKS